MTQTLFLKTKTFLDFILKRHLANLISYSRVLFTLMALGFYGLGYEIVFLCLVILAISSDFFDGYIARKFSAETAFGSVLDPACDKVFVVLMLSFLYLQTVISKFFCVALMMRSFVQIISFLIVHNTGIRFSAKPSLWAKTLNGILFFLIFFLSLTLVFPKEFEGESRVVFCFLVLVSFGEFVFMVYYPAQFYRILLGEKKVFE